MADPFLDNEEEGNLLEREIKRLRLETRELRLTNTNLRARLALVTPSASVDGDAHRPRLASTGPSRTTANSEADVIGAQTTTGETARDDAEHTAAASAHATDAAPSQRRTRGKAPASEDKATAQVSAARIQEAVQKAKRELHEELEQRRKSAAAEKAEKEQLKREFELFVSTTCEREAAYQLVHTQLYRELEEQREVVRSAQAQLEEQRLQSVEMRKSLEAAVAAAAVASAASASAATSSSAAATNSKGGLGKAPTVTAPSHPSRVSTAEAGESAEDDATTAPSTTKQHQQQHQQQQQHTEITPVPSSSSSRQRSKRLPKNLDWAGVADVASPAPQYPAVQEAETASAAASSAPDSTGPRPLRIVAGGAMLRSTRASQRGKRGRSAVSVASASQSQSADRRGARHLVELHMPVAPVFASSSTPAKTAPSSGSGNSNSTQRTGSHDASPGVSSMSSAAGPSSAAVESLWRLLAQHTAATQGFLPLWQHLAVLRGPDRHTVLRVLISVLVHLLGPEPTSTPTNASPRVSSAAALPVESPHLPFYSSLSLSFVTQPTSLVMVATAIRLMAVQLEDAAQQQRGTANAQQHAMTTLLGSLFYRMCVATLRRWQASDCAADALEHWATAVLHLYGFQPNLLQLMQYTNTTSAYHRTRLPRSWISYTAQGIFSQCFTTTSPSSVPSASSATAALPAETAAARWCELCDSVGWSTHAIPLERLETAAARCVAMTRVNHGPMTAACAEEALLSLRLIVLYKGFDHMECIAKSLEQPAVLPMAITKEIYAELVSLAVRDRVPFRTQDALHHALQLLREYLQEVGPERCSSAEHFVSAPRRSHVLAALALLRVDTATGTEAKGGAAPPSAAFVVTASNEVREAGRKAAQQWLQAQRAALDMVRQSRALAPDHLLLLRDSPLGRILMREAID